MDNPNWLPNSNATYVFELSLPRLKQICAAMEANKEMLQRLFAEEKSNKYDLLFVSIFC